MGNQVMFRTVHLDRPGGDADEEEGAVAGGGALDGLLREAEEIVEIDGVGECISCCGTVALVCLYVPIPWMIVYFENHTGSCDNVEAISVAASVIFSIVFLLGSLMASFFLGLRKESCIQPCARFLLTPSLLALLGLCAVLLVIHMGGECSEGSRGRRLAEVIPATYLAPLVLVSARYLLCGCGPCVITLQQRREDPCTVHLDRM